MVWPCTYRLEGLGRAVSDTGKSIIVMSHLVAVRSNLVDVDTGKVFLQSLTGVRLVVHQNLQSSELIIIEGSVVAAQDHRGYELRFLVKYIEHKLCGFLLLNSKRVRSHPYDVLFEPRLEARVNIGSPRCRLALTKDEDTARNLGHAFQVPAYIYIR